MEASDKQSNNESFRKACSHNEIQKVALLLKDPEVNVNLRDMDYTVLEQSIVMGYLEITKLLLDHPQIVIGTYRNPLALAAQHSRKEAVKILLEKKVDINQRDGIYGLTPLQHAEENIKYCKSQISDIVNQVQINNNVDETDKQLLLERLKEYNKELQINQDIAKLLKEEVNETHIKISSDYSDENNVKDIIGEDFPSADSNEPI